jgi:hypothetical protein
LETAGVMTNLIFWGFFVLGALLEERELIVPSAQQ